LKFSNLIGQVVSVRVGGNEFYGTTTKVGEDFLVIDSDTTGTVILPIEHLKSLRVGENVCGASSKSEKRTDSTTFGSTILPNEFAAVVEMLKQTVVRIEGGGVDSTVALLLDVLNDYVVLCMVPDGIVFLPVRHIKSIAPVDAYIQPEFSEWVKGHTNSVKYPNDLHDLLKTYFGKSLQLSRDSPEQISGILSDIDEYFAEFVTSPTTRAWIPILHIKSIFAFQRVEWIPAETDLSVKNQNIE
jgi:hypothetical protein